MKNYLLVVISCLTTIISLKSQPSLEFVNFYSEGNPSVYGQSASLLAVCSDGSHYQVGHYNNTVTLTGLQMLNNTQTGGNAYISRYDKDGNGLWRFKLETADNRIRIADIKVDSEDNLIITGRLDGRVDFDPGSGNSSVSTPGNPKGFIVKYDLSGNYLWHKEFGSTSWYVSGESLAIDNEDNIFITGDTGNVLTIGGTSLSTSPPTLYIARFRPNGIMDWVESYMKVFPYGKELIAVSGDKVTVVTAFTGHDFDPGPGTDFVQSLGENDLMLIQVDKENGELLEQDYIRREGKQIPSKVVGFVDGSYNLLYSSYDQFNNYIYGEIYSPSPDHHTFSVNADSFEITSFDLGANNDLYVALSGRRTAEYNPISNSFEFSGNPYAYLQKVSPSGEELWRHKWYASKGQSGVHMNVSDSKGIYVSGIYIGRGSFELDVEEDQYIASTEIDGFLVKWSDCPSQISYESAEGCSPVVHDDIEYFSSGTYIKESFGMDGCPILVEIDIDIYPVDSSIIASQTKIESSQSNLETDFIWTNYTEDIELSNTDNTLSPDSPGQFQFSFITNQGCEFESPIITFPEERIYRSPQFITFGEYVHLIDDKILVNGMFNFTSTIEEYGFNSLGDLITESAFSYIGEDLGQNIIPFKDGVLMSSNDNILRYYDRPEGEGLKYHSAISPSTQTGIYADGFGLALASYGNYIFVGAPLTNHANIFDESGIVKIYKLINDEWEWISDIQNPSNNDYRKFGESILVLENNLIITEPGYENQFGNGQIHFYDLSSWDEMTSLTQPSVSYISNEYVGDIYSDIHGIGDILYIHNDSQIFQLNINNLMESPSNLLTEGDYVGITNLNGHGSKLAFTTPDPEFDDSFQVHLYVKNGTNIDHEITFYPYVNSSRFGKAYDLNHEEIVIGAPTYFDGVDENKLGKVVRYKYDGLATDVMKIDFSDNDFSLFPNPTDGYISINYDRALSPNCSFIVTDILGKKLIHTCDSQIDLSALKCGIYIVSVLDKGLILNSHKVLKIE